MYEEAETLKAEIYSSQAFDSYKRFIAIRRIEEKLFGQAERVIRYRDMDLGPRLREGLEEIQMIVDRRKDEEVKQLEDQYVDTIEELKKEVDSQKKIIDDIHHECWSKAQSVLSTIIDQQNNISIAGATSLNANQNNQQALQNLLQSAQQEPDHSTLANNINMVTIALTDHIKSYNKVATMLENDCKNYKDEINSLNDTVTLKNK